MRRWNLLNSKSFRFSLDIGYMIYYDASVIKVIGTGRYRFRKYGYWDRKGEGTYVHNKNNSIQPK